MIKSLKNFVGLMCYRTAAVILFALMGLMFVGCATSYLPSSHQLGCGYTETFYKPEQVSICFKGNDFTHRQTCEDYAMLRAAELGLENNFKYFEIVNRDNISYSKTHSYGSSSSSTHGTGYASAGKYGTSRSSTT